MLKLHHLATRTVTSQDLGITCAGLSFEVKTVVDRQTNSLMATFEQTGYSNAELACEIIGRCFVSVTQDGVTYPLGSKEAAEGLRHASDVGGDEFVCVLVDKFISDHYGFFLRDSADSEAPSPA